MTKQNTKQKIMIVDDTPENIETMMKLIGSDYRLVPAVNGETCLKLARSKNPPDLILLDIVMPGMDGYEVCRRLKNDDATKEIPIIFVTAKSEDEDEARGLQLGAVDYIRKPFYWPIVKARVKMILELKMKTDMLAELVSIDGLTNIYNRRMFEEVLDREWSRCRRSGECLSLAMIDVDYFKQFNDNYGHASGDDCLRKVAMGLRNAMRRPGDFVARYGGEEFVVILPETDANGAESVVDNLKSTIEALNIPHGFSATADHVTVSIGLVTVIPPHDMAFPLDLVKSADEMLYLAKQSGRNRIAHKDYR